MHVKSELTREINEHKVKKVLICTDICCELLYNSKPTNEISSLYWISQWSTLQSFWENKICCREIYNLSSKTCTWYLTKSICVGSDCGRTHWSAALPPHVLLWKTSMMQTYHILSTKPNQPLLKTTFLVDFNYIQSKINTNTMNI